jgi:hypothetical protein
MLDGLAHVAPVASAPPGSLEWFYNRRNMGATAQRVVGVATMLSVHVQKLLAAVCGSKTCRNA